MILIFLKNLQNQKNQSKNKKQILTLKNAIILNGRQKVLIASESGIFPKRKQGTGLKVLTSKQIIQRLSITLAHVKAGNTSENLLNEIRQIFYSLYQSKEISIQVYNNKIKSMQIQN